MLTQNFGGQIRCIMGNVQVIDWVVGRASLVVGRGLWVVGRASWVVRRASRVVRSYRDSLCLFEQTLARRI